MNNNEFSKSFDHQIKGGISAAVDNIDKVMNRIIPKRIVTLADSSDSADSIDSELQKELNELKKELKKTKNLLEDEIKKSNLLKIENIKLTKSLSSTQMSSVVENSKYISNLRSELNQKHQRHINDLQTYYEKELEEVRKNIQPSSTSQIDLKNISINNELKNSNEMLLSSLQQNADHIKYLTRINRELSLKMESNESYLNEYRHNAEEKIYNLENCCKQLEIQLTDTIKVCSFFF
jgi:F0F1-type ATP synthase membrane subunit b/b'